MLQWVCAAVASAADLDGELVSALAATLLDMCYVLHCISTLSFELTYRCSPQICLNMDDAPPERSTGFKTRAFFNELDLNPGELHSHATLDDGTVMLFTLRATTVLSRNCCGDFGPPVTKEVMSHSHDSLNVTAPLPTNVVPLTGVWNPSPFHHLSFKNT